MTQNGRNYQRYNPSTQRNWSYRSSQHSNHAQNTKEEQIPENKTNTPISLWYKNLNTADRIALWGTLINATLAIATYLLFNIAVNESKKTQRALDISDSTLHATMKFNDSTINIQALAYEKSVKDGEAQGEKDRTTLALQKKSVEAQINALKETQKQFNYQNRAFLQITKFDTLNVKGFPVGAKFVINNIGSQPIRLMSLTSNVGFGKKELTYEEIVKSVKEVGFNIPITKYGTYITKESPYTIYKDADQGEYNINLGKEFVAGNRVMYLFGKIRYINMVTEQKFVYEYCLNKFFNDGAHFGITYNENYPDTDK